MDYKICLAVKTSGIESQLYNAIRVANQAGITGMEIQALPSLLEKSNEYRALEIAKACENNRLGISRLAYHMPFYLENGAWNGMKNALENDLCSTEGECMLDTLEKKVLPEAAMVGERLKIETEIPVIVHLMGFVTQHAISAENRIEKLKLGEDRLLYLHSMAAEIGKARGCNLTIARENNTPSHKVNFDAVTYPVGLVDFDPRDLMETAEKGIGIVLDLSHLQLIYNYIKNGDGMLPQVDADIGSYDTKLPPVMEMISSMAPHLKVMHINDSTGGYLPADEGLEAGKGIIVFREIIPAASRGLSQDIIGTLEIEKSHLYPETMGRSHGHLKGLFGDAFSEYFA